MSYDENAGKGNVETKSHGKLEYYGRQTKLLKGEKYTFNLIQGRIFQIHVFDTYSDTCIVFYKYICIILNRTKYLVKRKPL